MSDFHIKDKEVLQKSNELDNRKIAVAVTGGIGAVEVVKIIRELRRAGALVTAFMTTGAKRFVGPVSLEWATGKSLGDVQSGHVEYLEDWDLVIVCPATLNTIQQCAHGFSGNSATLLVATQLGARKPILIVPTMNIRMRNHPLYDDSIKRLKGWGASVLESPVEEGRIKMPTPETILRYVIELCR